MTIVMGLVVIGFFVVLGAKQRQENRERSPRKPLPRAQLRDKS